MDATVNYRETGKKGQKMKKSLLILLLVNCIFPSLYSQKVIPLYEGKVPGSEDWTQQEREMKFPGFNIVLVQNVTKPTLRVYQPAVANAGHTAIIVAPGGGFETIVEGVEGTPVAEWLNSKGITVFLLRYRLFKTNDDFINKPGRVSGLEQDLVKRFDLFRKELRPLVLTDARQAVKYVREHAAEYGIDPHHIGFMGFSAGGCVTSIIAREYDAGSRPDFVVPVYAATFEKITAPADAPPMFLALASDDKTVSPDNSLDLYKAWKEAGCTAELHIYSKGGHGFGVRKQGLPVDTWTDRLEEWLKLSGFLK
jgi:acetyl esterase/lipase